MIFRKMWTQVIIAEINMIIQTRKYLANGNQRKTFGWIDNSPKISTVYFTTEEVSKNSKTKIYGMSG